MTSRYITRRFNKEPYFSKNTLWMMKARPKINHMAERSTSLIKFQPEPDHMDILKVLRNMRSMR